ncbi:unnamed protein product [Schistocephalus solidus]|uniref:Reverse transcriptase domain-containing protein n=1 Tax=Schistocephalus solidus TaxID=70667 RepID=A0A183S954_SCHSO|nr:unnamed protein product [Schistocephalus solidus]
MKNFFEAIKAIYGPCIKGTAQLLGSDGTTLLTKKSQILKRWPEHYRSVLDRSSAISNAAIDRLPQVDTNNDLDLTLFLPETIWAVQQISSGKAPGTDAIPPEVYKHGGPRLMSELTTLFKEMWRQGQVSQDFKDATIVHLYKRKGNRQLYDNHRGITLLNIAGKIFARLLLNRLKVHVDDVTSNCAQFRIRHLTGSDGGLILWVGERVMSTAQRIFLTIKNVARLKLSRCGGTPMSGSGRASHLRILPPPVFLILP